MVSWFKRLDTKWQVAVLAIGALFILGVLNTIFGESDTPSSTQTGTVEQSQDASPTRNAAKDVPPTLEFTPTRIAEAKETSTTPPTPLAQPSHELIPALRVSDSGCNDDYDRDQWAPSSSKWSAARQATAHEEGPELIGYWTGLPIATLSDADIDHHVPVKHAHISGGCHWNESRRNAFYTDLDNLNVTTPSMNRSKSDRAPGHWGRQDEFIDTPAERCEYAAQWINIKRQYELHFITAQEIADLTDMLSDCGKSPSLITTTRSATPVPAAAPSPTITRPETPTPTAAPSPTITRPETPTPTAAPSPTITRPETPTPTAAPSPTITRPETPTPTAAPSPTMDTPSDVKVYKNCTELRKDFPNGITKVEHPEVYAANIQRDRDKDGSACE